MKNTILISIAFIIATTLHAQGKTIKLSGQILGAEGKTIYIIRLKTIKLFL